MSDMNPPIRSICVYCGSRDGLGPAYLRAAVELGEAIAAAGLRLVYGGARIGLMGAVADAARAGGADVLGVIPRQLTAREVAHEGLTELKVVRSMHERKQAMSDAADAFIALPGGFGTLEEFFEILTWHQLGDHDKPCGLLDIDGFYAPLIAYLEYMSAQGFVSREQVERIQVASRASTMLERLGVSRVASPLDDVSGK